MCFLFSIVGQHGMADSMFLILMLQQLTEIAIHNRTLRTLIGIVRDLIVVVSSIGDHGELGHVTMHGSFLRSKAPDLFPRIVPSTALRTSSVFDMLHCVCARFEASITTNGTRDVAGAVHLHVHLQVVAVLKGASALVTTVRAVDAFPAAGSAGTFASLVVTVAHGGLGATAFCTVTTRAIDAINATRRAGTFAPLIVGEFVGIAVVIAVGAVASHCVFFSVIDL